MLQDNRGYLWMGTRGGGITVFDGINFKILTTKEGLVDSVILTLAVEVFLLPIVSIYLVDINILFSCNYFVCIKNVLLNCCCLVSLF